MVTQRLLARREEWLNLVEDASGSAFVRAYRTIADASSHHQGDSKNLIIAPPYFAPGDWVVEVRAEGATEFTVISEAVSLEDPAWDLPLEFNIAMGDTGQLDLAQGDFDFYAVSVPEGNRGLVRTVLEEISGDTDFYLRHGAIPTLSHDLAGNDFYGRGDIFDRSTTGSETKYGNWVPLDRRQETEITPGMWYFAVHAAGSTNARYRLRVDSGKAQDMLLDGGEFTNQTLAETDWRYFRVEVPEDAPLEWRIHFQQEQGSVSVYLRDTVPPGNGIREWDQEIRHWGTEKLNNGPHPVLATPGTHMVTSPPLRPGHIYYLGVYAHAQATFSLATSTAGGTMHFPELDFLNGDTAGTIIAANAGAIYRVRVPEDAIEWRQIVTGDAGVAVAIEQGAPPLGESHHWLQRNDQRTMSRHFLGWPWVTGEVFYVGLINETDQAQEVHLRLSGLLGGAARLAEGAGLDIAWNTSNDPSRYSPWGFRREAAGNGYLRSGTAWNWSDLETEVSGPGIIRFSWRADNATPSDPFRFYVAGTQQISLSTTTNWEEVSVEVPAGANLLRWRAESSSSSPTWGYLRNVEWLPDPTTGFAAWAEALPEDQRAAGDDPGGHGIANLLRYAFDLDPLRPDRRDLPQVGREVIHSDGEDQTHLTIAFTRRKGESGIIYRIEASGDLLNWAPIAPIEVIEDHGNGETETVTAADPEPLSGNARFLRVRVE